MPETLEAIEERIGADRIGQRVQELGQSLSADYSGRPLTLLPVLNGAMVFAADLMRAIDGEVRLDSIRVQSYQGTRSSGTLNCHYFPQLELTGADVLIVDDILDTGRTLSRIAHLLWEHNPHSVRTCVLLDKPSRREVEFEADYVGFRIPDEFVVGYGLDYNESYRNLPHVGALRTDP